MPRGKRVNFVMASNVLHKIKQNGAAKKVEGWGLQQRAIEEHETTAYRAPRQRAFAKPLPPGRLPGARVPVWIVLVWGALLVVNAIAKSQTATPAPSTANDGVASSIVSAPARSWAVDVAANELIALHHKDSYLRYRMHSLNEKGDRVRDIIESRDGTVARLILRNGKPLTQDEDRAEQQRLNDMLASPSTFAKHVKSGESEKKIADRLVPLMPDAMLYSYTPGQPQTGNNDGTREVVLDYKPNPKFSPPNTEAEALTGLQGRIWIDAKTRHLVRMEGNIFRPVNFGWGVLAHLYPGGKLVLDQTNAGGDRWIFTRFSMRLSARALMVKTVNVNSTVEAGSFQTMGPISYQDAIHMLLETPLPVR
jgi:hypothetical protein